MSMYVGRNSGDPLLHITAGINTIAELKAGQRSNTIFHSNLNYVTWTKQTISFDNEGGRLYISLSASLASTIGSTIPFIVTIGSSVFRGGVVTSVYLPETRPSWTYGMWFPSYYGAYYPAYFPSSTYTRFLLPSGTVSSDVSLYTLNISGGTFLGVTKPLSDIKIKTGEVTVKGVNLLNLKYINSGQINTLDSVYSLGSKNLQFINSIVNPSDSISLKSNSSGTSIKKGIHSIFDTASGGTVIYRGKSTGSIVSRTFQKPGFTQYTDTYTFTHPISNGNNLVIVRVIPGALYDETIGGTVPIILGTSGETNIFQRLDATYTGYRLYITTSGSTITVSRYAWSSGETSYKTPAVGLEFLYF